MRTIDGTIVAVVGAVVGHKVHVELRLSTMRPSQAVRLSSEDVTCLLHDLEAERVEAFQAWNRRAGDLAVVVDEHDPQGPMPRKAP